MPAWKRKDITALLKELKQGKTYPAFLIFGERFLCREIAGEIISTLLPEKNQTANLKNLDGDQEDPENTLNLLRTFNLFPGSQIIRVTDSRLFHSKTVSKSIWEKAKNAHDANDSKEAGRYLAQLIDTSGADLDELEELNANGWKNLFGFPKPSENLSWIKETIASTPPAKNSASTHSKSTDIADRYVDTLEAGIPKNNILILLADTVDKRKRLYKFMAKNCAVIDLSVDTGFSTAARNEQDVVLRELVERTLADFNKKIEPKALTRLLERVGFHPVAVVMETEKIALYTGDQTTISSRDIDAVIGRTREEAMYELTEAFAAGNLSEAILIFTRLREHGIHPLAVLSGLRNITRKLLMAKAFQGLKNPRYSRQSFDGFQKGYLPSLKACLDEPADILSGHPYVVYKLFTQAESFSIAHLKKGLSRLLETEFQIKSTGISDALLLENYLFGQLLPAAPEIQRADFS